MIKVALVGNIASGKSTVEKFLFNRGYSILDTDLVAHKLLDEYSDKIKDEFSSFDISDENGKISREKLGKLVFTDTNLKEKLENILHPLIRIQIEEFFKAQEGEKFVFVAIPLLFEARMEDLFDKKLFVYSDDNIRLERLMKRNKYTLEYAKIRIASQIPQEDKINKCDWVVYNNSTIKDLEQQISSILAE